MPLDAGGNYRHNDEVARFHSKSQGKPHPSDGAAEGGEHVEIHPHGDGTFHTMHKGEQVDHETHGHALMHAAKVHAEEGHKHFHAHHDGGVLHTHSENDHQEHDGEDHEGAQGHFSEFLGGSQQPEEDTEEEAENATSHKGLGQLY